MISGTSHDGIDVTTVDFTLSGDGLSGEVTYFDTVPYEPSLRARLLAALPPATVSLGEVCALDTLIGKAFASAAAAVAGIDLICSHGQTVFHWPGMGTLQIGQAAWIAERAGVPVVSDVRVRDMAAGGQGAPLVALLDSLLLAGLPGRAAALNLGGIANITVPRPSPLAYDIGPASALIDAATFLSTGGAQHYDRDGLIAASGTVSEALLRRFLAEPYYRLAPPKSTGKELFNAAYLDGLTPGPDMVATVTALTAHTVAAAVRAHGIDTLVVSGGGVRNPTLISLLRQQLPGVRLVPSDELGAPGDAKEAIAFALIGWLTWHGLPANVPAGTGARGPRVLGAITPGVRPLRLPAPLSEIPALSLRTRRAPGSASWC